MNENNNHFNVNVILEHIKNQGYSRFAVVKGYSEDQYFISPVSELLNTRYGAVYDNEDIQGRVIMSKEAMMINFTLLYGYTVDYEWDDHKGAIPFKK